jgi:hypothetical protein
MHLGNFNAIEKCFSAIQQSSNAFGKFLYIGKCFNATGMCINAIVMCVCSIENMFHWT